MHQVQMTDAQKDAAIEKARALGTFFKQIGPKYDEANSFAYESIQAFKDSGLGSVPVPVEYGGQGGDILTTSKIITEMSRGDSAITLSYNMHFIMLGIMQNLMSEEQNAHWLGKVAQGGIMFGPFSEERAGFSGLADTKAVPQPGGGWKLYGKKNWGTLCEAADIVTTNATITDAAGNIPTDFEERVNAETLFIADFKVDNLEGDGVRIEKTWDAMGMHATGTQVIHFDGFFVPESGFVCEWRAGGFNNLEWASLMFASVYYGMSLRCYDETKAIIEKKYLGATFGAIVAAETKVSTIGSIRDALGKMQVTNELSRRVLHATCQQLLDGKDDDWPAELRVPYIGIAKIFIADNVMNMTRRAMSLVGGQSFRHGHPLERLYRDSAASAFQPLSADQTYTYIGDYELAGDELSD